MEILISRTSFREDYAALRAKLFTLPDKLNYDVQVPFGSLAFMPGKILHTNEILVLLGDGWLVERSAKDACDIVDRRIASCDETLKKLEVERKHFENWLQHTGEVRDQMDGTVEIIEEYDEEAEKLWAERHRVSVKRYKEMINRDRVMIAEHDAFDVTVKHDALEMEKENNSDNEPSEFEGDSRCGSDDSNSKSDHSNQESESKGVMQKTVADTTNKDIKEKKVRFQKSEVIDDTVRESQESKIKVAFTSECVADSSLPLLLGDQSSVSSITSPADIFTHFGGGSDETPVHETKSILKRYSSFKESQMAATSDSEVDFMHDDYEKPCRDVVVEHEPTSGSNKEIAEAKPISLFKTRKSKH